MRISGWFLLRQMAQKLDRKSIKEVTIEDMCNYGHIGSKENPALFEEQIDMETAKEIVENPKRVWES